MRRFLISLGATLAACALSPPHPYAIRDDLDRDAVQRLHLAPLNAIDRAPEEVMDAAPRVREAVRAYLEAHGREVVESAYYPYRRAWSRAFAGVELPTAPRRPRDPLAYGPPPPSDVMAGLIRNLDPRGEVDALLVPDLLIRPARLNGAIARWDGVRRKLESSRPLPARGHTNAISLRLRLFDRDGALLFEGIGGLDMLFRFDVAGSRAVLVDEVLSTPAHIEEGVSIAFHPFFDLAE